MGNCLKRPSTAKYTTDDDEFWDNVPEKEVSDFPATDISGGIGKTVEVKIKITKKQLEALLGRVEVKDLRVEQVLAQLSSHSHRFQTHQRPWKPALQSIPELDERFKAPTL